MPQQIRSPLPVYATGTISGNGGSAVITGVNSAWMTPDASGTLVNAVMGGDVLITNTVGIPIKSVDSATQITLEFPLPATINPGSSYRIVKVQPNLTGGVTSVLAALQKMGSDDSPDASRTIDNGAGRIKIRVSDNGDLQVAVGPSGAADAALVTVFDISQAGKITYPQGSGLAADLTYRAPAFNDFKAAGAGTSAADIVATLQSAASSNLPVILNDAYDVTGQTIPVTSYWDAVLRGSGSIKGLYRKYVVPSLAPTDYLDCGADVVPAIHLRRFNTAANPVVVMVADSIGTEWANSVGHGCMLSNTVRRHLDRAARKRGATLSFVNRSIAGLSWYDLDNNVSPTSPGPPWVTATASWLSYIQAQSPDLIVISLGMNAAPYSGELAAIRSVMTKIAAWPKVPDVLVCTNLIPRPSATFSPPTYAGSDFPEARISSSGVIRAAVRSGLLALRVGLLDFSRKQMMAQFGVDPVSGVFRTGSALSAVAGSYVAAEQTIDGFGITVGFDATQLTVGTSKCLVIPTGSGNDDVLQISQPASGSFLATFIAGPGAPISPWAYATATFGATAESANGLVWLRIEKYDGNLYIYPTTSTFASDGGAYLAPLVVMPAICQGGLFTPRISDTVSGAALKSVVVDFVDPHLNIPSISADSLWGTGFPTQVGVDGGSGLNHPSNFAATHIYGPVLRSVHLCSGDPSKVVNGAFSAALNSAGGFEIPGDFLVDGNVIAITNVFEVSRSGLSTQFTFGPMASPTGYWTVSGTGDLVMQTGSITTGKLTANAGVYDALGHQVVGARQGAISNSTDTSNAATTVNAVLAALRAHGLISP